jgi:hypothetical protein
MPRSTEHLRRLVENIQTYNSTGRIRLASLQGEHLVQDLATFIKESSGRIKFSMLGEELK